MTPISRAIVKPLGSIAERMNGASVPDDRRTKVDIIWGEAKLTKAGRGSLVAKTRKKIVEPQGPHPEVYLGRGHQQSQAPFIVATGARPRRVAGHRARRQAESEPIFEAMKPEKMPKSLLVMGSATHRHRISPRSTATWASTLPWLKSLRPSAGRGRRDLALRQEAVRQAGHGKMMLEAKRLTKVEKSTDSIHRPCRDEGRPRSKEGSPPTGDLGCRLQGNIEDLGLGRAGA